MRVSFGHLNVASIIGILTPAATVKALCDQGVVPLEYDYKESKKQGKPWSVAETQSLFMGQCVGLVDEIKPAREIVEELVRDAIAAMQRNQSTITYAKL
jgi:hypothetical protein